MSRRSWVTSSLARRLEIFCWVFSGQTTRPLMLLGPTVETVAQRFGIRLHPCSVERALARAQELDRSPKSR